MKIEIKKARKDMFHQAPRCGMGTCYHHNDDNDVLPAHARCGGRFSVGVQHKCVNSGGKHKFCLMHTDDEIVAAIRHMQKQFKKYRKGK